MDHFSDISRIQYIYDSTINERTNQGFQKELYNFRPVCIHGNNCDTKAHDSAGNSTFCKGHYRKRQGEDPSRRYNGYDQRNSVSA